MDETQGKISMDDLATIVTPAVIRRAPLIRELTEDLGQELPGEACFTGGQPGLSGELTASKRDVRKEGRGRSEEREFISMTDYVEQSTRGYSTGDSEGESESEKNRKKRSSRTGGKTQRNDGERWGGHAVCDDDEDSDDGERIEQRVNSEEAEESPIFVVLDGNNSYFYEDSKSARAKAKRIGRRAEIQVRPNWEEAEEFVNWKTREGTGRRAEISGKHGHPEEGESNDEIEKMAGQRRERSRSGEYDSEVSFPAGRAVTEKNRGRSAEIRTLPKHIYDDAWDMRMLQLLEPLSQEEIESTQRMDGRHIEKAASFLRTRTEAAHLTVEEARRDSVLIMALAEAVSFDNVEVSRLIQRLAEEMSALPGLGHTLAPRAIRDAMGQRGQLRVQAGRLRNLSVFRAREEIRLRCASKYEGAIVQQVVKDMGGTRSSSREEKMVRERHTPERRSVGSGAPSLWADERDDSDEERGGSQGRVLDHEQWGSTRQDPHAEMMDIIVQSKFLAYFRVCRKLVDARLEEVAHDFAWDRYQAWLSEQRDATEVVHASLAPVHWINTEKAAGMQTSSQSQTYELLYDTDCMLCYDWFAAVEDAARDFRWPVRAHTNELLRGRLLGPRAKEKLAGWITAKDSILSVPFRGNEGEIPGALEHFYKVRYRLAVLFGGRMDASAVQTRLNAFRMVAQRPSERHEEYVKFKTLYLCLVTHTPESFLVEVKRMGERTTLGQEWIEAVEENLGINKKIARKVKADTTLKYEDIDEASQEWREKAMTTLTAGVGERGRSVRRTNALITQDSSRGDPSGQSRREVSRSPSSGWSDGEKAKGYPSGRGSERSAGYTTRGGERPPGHPGRGGERQSGPAGRERSQTPYSGGMRSGTARDQPAGDVRRGGDARRDRDAWETCEACGCRHLEEAGRGRCPWRRTKSDGTVAAHGVFNGWDPRQFSAVSTRVRNMMWDRMHRAPVGMRVPLEREQDFIRAGSSK